MIEAMQPAVEFVQQHNYWEPEWLIRAHYLLEQPYAKPMLVLSTLALLNSIRATGQTFRKD